MFQRSPSDEAVGKRHVRMMARRGIEWHQAGARQTPFELLVKPVHWNVSPDPEVSKDARQTHVIGGSQSGAPSLSQISQFLGRARCEKGIDIHLPVTRAHQEAQRVAVVDVPGGHQRQPSRNLASARCPGQPIEKRVPRRTDEGRVDQIETADLPA